MSKTDAAKAHGDTQWWQLLDEQLTTRTLADVARTMGVSRPYLARVRSGSIASPSLLFIGRVLSAFHRVQCPHLHAPLEPSACAAYATKSYGAVTGPDELRHWRACQKCPHHPTTGSDNLMHGPKTVRPVVVTRLDLILANRSNATAPSSSSLPTKATTP